MEIDRYTEHLTTRGIKPTAIRLLVLKAIMERQTVFTLLDMEIELGTVDKSTLFRTLGLFQQHRLIHSIDDGSGSLKYAVCDDECDCEVGQLHVHFLCTNCNRAFCMRDTNIPAVELPIGFTADSINYVVKGRCAKCSKFAT